MGTSNDAIALPCAARLYDPCARWWIKQRGEAPRFDKSEFAALILNSRECAASKEMHAISEWNAAAIEITTRLPEFLNIVRRDNPNVLRRLYLEYTDPAQQKDVLHSMVMKVARLNLSLTPNSMLPELILSTVDYLSPKTVGSKDGQLAGRVSLAERLFEAVYPNEVR